MLQSMGSQRVGHDLTTKQQQQVPSSLKKLRNKTPIARMITGTIWSPLVDPIFRRKHKSLSHAQHKALKNTAVCETKAALAHTQETCSSSLQVWDKSSYLKGTG